MVHPMLTPKTWSHPAALALSLALAACTAGGAEGVDEQADPTADTVQALDAPQLVASTTRVDLGRVGLGSARGAVITLTNLGRTDADITGIRIVPPDPYNPELHNPPSDHDSPDQRPLPEGAITERYGDFNAIAIVPCVRPQASQTLLVGFTPTNVGPQGVEVVVSYVDGAGGHEIVIKVSASGSR
jgi:hypothetical protein